MGNVPKYRIIKPVLNDKKKRNYRVYETNYYSAKSFAENLNSIEFKKLQFKMNKPIYLGFSNLDLSKIQMRDVFAWLH